MNRLLLSFAFPVVTYGVIIAEQTHGADKAIVDVANEDVIHGSMDAIDPGELGMMMPPIVMAVPFDGDGEGFPMDGLPVADIVVSSGPSRSDHSSHKSMWDHSKADSIAEQSPVVEAAGAAPSSKGQQHPNRQASDASAQGGPDGGEAIAVEQALKQMLTGNAGMQARMAAGGSQEDGDAAKDDAAGKDAGKGAVAGKDGAGKGESDGKGMILPEGAAIPMGAMMAPMMGMMRGPGGMVMMMPRKLSAEDKKEMEKDKQEISAVTEAELEADEEEEAKEKKEMAEAANSDASPKDVFEEAEEVRPKLAIIAEKEAATGHVSELSKKEDKQRQEKKEKKKNEEAKEGADGKKKDKSQMEKILLDHKLQV